MLGELAIQFQLVKVNLEVLAPITIAV